MPDETIRRYLTSHAEPAAGDHADRVSGHYQRAIVIPMFDETSDALGQIFRHNKSRDTLIIAVVNAPLNAPPDATARTCALLSALTGETAHKPPHTALHVIDCVSPQERIPTAQGVGLVRKLGTDIAVHLYARGQLTSPWLYQTDADAVLPKDYFAANLNGRGATVFGHQHFSADPQLRYAAQLYDMHMAYYHTSLAAQGSRYAFPTLGSTIVVHAHAYCAVRGYPKRNAAEDFYLLNKIAKVAEVKYQPTPTLELRARTSSRVPFGTGPALQKIVAGLHEDQSGAFYKSYHPQSFTLLGTALRYFRAYAEDAQAATSRNVQELLDVLRFQRVAPTITAQYAPGVRRHTALTDWFDARRTMRFIHEARRYNPDQPLLQTLRGLPARRQNAIGFTGTG